MDVVTAVSHTHATRLQEKVGKPTPFTLFRTWGMMPIFNVRPGAFGLTRQILAGPPVRKAVASLWTERYVQELLDGWGVLMNSPSSGIRAIPPRTSRCTPQSQTPASERAGWRPGSDGLRRKWGQIPAFTLTVRSDNPLEKALAELAGGPGLAGHSSGFQPVTLSDMLLNHIYTGKFHVAHGLSVALTPTFSMPSTRGLNLSGYNNPS